jgi:hypothetical protein
LEKGIFILKFYKHFTNDLRIFYKSLDDTNKNTNILQKNYVIFTKIQKYKTYKNNDNDSDTDSDNDIWVNFVRPFGAYKLYIGAPFQGSHIEISFKKRTGILY